MISFPMMLFRLGLALLLGAAIGLERERHLHSAGLRTNALVALGSALYMLISLYGFTAFLGLPHIQVDPSRIASYVVAGIGFLGGGAIAFHREQERVRGLTTAAGIWIVAALGLACGAGLVVEALTATVLALFVLIALRWAERWLLHKSEVQQHRLQIEATSVADHLLEDVTATCGGLGLALKHMKVRTDQPGMRVEVVCLVPTDVILAQALSKLQVLPGVQAVQADLEGLPRNLAV
jgi:putative Mg2+ transporter-C (MgtC) family protein